MADVWLTLAGALVGGLAGSLASILWQIRAQGRQTKRDNSINAMSVLQRDGGLSRAMNIVAEIDTGFRPNGQKDSVVFYASLGALRDGTAETEWDKDSRKKSRALLAVVDYFEAVSVGILRNIYDREVVREIARGTFVQMYKRTKPFIEEARKGGDFGSFGQNFERVAKEFSSE